MSDGCLTHIPIYTYTHNPFTHTSIKPVFNTFFNTAGGSDKPYIALPNRNHPRVILPLSGKRAFVKGFQIHNTASPLNRLLRKVMIHSRTVLYLWRSRRVYPTTAFHTLLAEIQAHVDIETIRDVSVYIGTPGSANQKITIQLMDGNCDVAGFVKVADNNTAARYLKNEQNAINKLSGITIETFEYPGDLHLFNVQTYTCLHQENIFENAAACGYTLHDPVYNAALEMAQKSAVTDNLAAFYSEKSQQLNNLTKEPYIQHSLQSALEQLDKQSIHPIFIHGDFVPYNIKLKNDKLALIDWEFFRSRGFPLYDLFTFVFQGGVQILKKEPRVLVDELLTVKGNNGRFIRQYLQQLNIDGSLLKPLLLLYFAEALHHYLTLSSDADPLNNHDIAGLTYLYSKLLS